MDDYYCHYFPNYAKIVIIQLFLVLLQGRPSVLHYYYDTGKKECF